VAIHPLVNEIEEHTNQWVLDFKLIESYETFVTFRDSQFGHFIGRSFPEAEFMTICAWSDLNALLFLVDDQIDAEDIIKDKESFFAYTSRFIEVLENKEKCNIEEHGSTLAALSDFWQRAVLLTDSRWQDKFIKSIHDMFDGGFFQFQHLMMGTRPKFEDYIKVRQYFGAAHLSTDALEGVAGIDLPEYVYKDPIVFRLTEIARNTICFSNDLFSFGKEMEEKNNGAEFNLVKVLKHKYNITTEEAIEKAVEFHDDLIREFIYLAPMALKYEPAINNTLKVYIEALKVLQRGNIEWSTRETKRYPHIYKFEAVNSIHT